MKRTLTILVAMFLVALAPFACFAAAIEDRADWGVVISTGAGLGSRTVLVRNAQGFSLLVVDTFARIFGPSKEPLTLDRIRPGDRIEYAVSTFAGAGVVDLIHVTPRQQLRRTNATK